jgi:HEAT repeat protein
MRYRPTPMWTAPPLPRTLEAALRDLDEASARVRASAVVDLARHHDDDAARPRGGAAPRRGGAAAARPRVHAALRRMLSDDAHEVRSAAASALGEVRAPEALGELLIATEDKHGLVRQLALEALGFVGGERAVERVRRALSDPRPELRFQAVLAYPRLAPGDAHAALAAAADDDDAGVRYIALRVAEERLHPPEGSLLDHADAADPADAADDRRPPRELLDAARRCLADDEARVRVAAAILLARGGDASAEPVLLDVIEDRLRTPELEDEAAAVELAGAIGLARATTALERRAYGPARFFRERCSFHARIGLARLGHARARGDILRELAAWSRETRTLAVMSAGRARLADARAQIQAMQGRPERADEHAVAEALAALSLPDGGARGSGQRGPSSR